MTAPTRKPVQISFPEFTEHDRDWRTKALCRDFVDDGVWCPEDPRDAAFGKSICNGSGTIPGCPVRESCLAVALARREKFGTWGGQTEWEREEFLNPGSARYRKHRKVLSLLRERGDQ